MLLQTGRNGLGPKTVYEKMKWDRKRQNTINKFFLRFSEIQNVESEEGVSGLRKYFSSCNIKAADVE